MSHLMQSLAVCRDWLIRPYLVIRVCSRLIGLFVLSRVSLSFYLYPFPLCNFMPPSSLSVCVCVWQPAASLSTLPAMWESDTDKDGLSCTIRIRKLHSLSVADSVGGLLDDTVSQNLLKLLSRNGRLIAVKELIPELCIQSVYHWGLYFCHQWLLTFSTQYQSVNTNTSSCPWGTWSQSRGSRVFSFLGLIFSLDVAFAPLCFISWFFSLWKWDNFGK